MAIFINTTTKVTSLGLAHLFIQHVFSKHGLPTDIISNQGNKFISAFWKSLCESLGIQQSLSTQSLSTAYRPQTDGQTEGVNKVSKMFLRLYVNYKQNNWSKYVALAEFAYNNSPLSTNKGFNPRLEITLAPGTKEAHSVEITRIKGVHEHAKREILQAQEVQKKYADKEQIEVHTDFQVGKGVWLSKSQLPDLRGNLRIYD
ncbi:hypothetical protein P7C70_g9139, partial [Phenoliferia sp. Uapishka_3]